MKKIVTFFLVVFCFPVGVSAAFVTISGTVLSSVAEQPLIHVELLVDGELASETNLTGEFEISKIESGNVLRVKKDGYVGISAIPNEISEELVFHLAPVWKLDSATQIYTDISDTDWFEPSVRSIYEMHALSASKSEEFRPADKLTRGELAMLVVNAAGFLPIDIPETSFCDVSFDDKFASAVEFMFIQNWINGYDSESCELGRTFNPAEPVSRAAAVKMILAVFGDLVRSKIQHQVCFSAEFEDVPIDSWFAEFVNNANCLGIVKGYDDGYFRPANSINRAEIAAVLANVFKKLF